VSVVPKGVSDITRSRAGVSVVLALAVVSTACGGAPSEAPLAVASPSAVPTVRYTPIPTVAPTIAPVATPSATPEPKWDELPSPANDPAALAAQLLMVERSIRDPQMSGQKLVWLGHFQQLIYGQLRDFPEWIEPIVASLPAEIQTTVKGTLEAGKQLRRLSGPTPKTFPDWRIVEPAPIDALLGYYKEAEKEFGVPWHYLAAINLVETRMGRIRGVSSAGAQGPMQFMPGTWAAYGKGDVNDPRDAILGAARYLKASGAPGDMARALFAYNRHDGYVRGIMAYADVMKADPNAYRGYYGWQVYYPTIDGVFLLAVGWTKPKE
jgi:soluble lytic murein transglycosylase-like protein